MHDLNIYIHIYFIPIKIMIRRPPVFIGRQSDAVPTTASRQTLPRKKATPMLTIWPPLMILFGIEYRHIYDTVILYIFF